MLEWQYKFMRINSVEDARIRDIDRPSDQEIERLGLLAEELVVNSINLKLPEFKAKLSTVSEDSGVKDIGSRQIIDGVLYHKDKAVLGMQITNAEDPQTIQRKMSELVDRPVIRLSEMKPKDPGIPKVLVILKRETIKAYDQNAQTQNDPEVIIQILDGIIKSLKFHLTTNKDADQRKVIQQSLIQFTEVQKRFLH